MALMSTGPATAAAVESTLKIELLESTPTAEKAIKGFVAPGEEGEGAGRGRGRGGRNGGDGEETEAINQTVFHKDPAACKYSRIRSFRRALRLDLE
jgi:hypothetical protein